jgi:hypothetical protein
MKQWQGRSRGIEKKTMDDKKNTPRIKKPCYERGGDILVPKYGILKD